MTSIFWNLILKKPWAVIIFHILLLPVLFWGISQADFHASFEPRDFLSADEYSRLESESGKARKETVALVLSAPEGKIIPPATIKTLSQSLEKLGEIKDITSESELPQKSGNDFFKIGQGSSLILLEPAKEGYLSIHESKRFQRLIAETVSQTLRQTGISFQLIGGPVTRIAAHKTFYRDALRVFLPLTLLILCIPFFFYRSVSYVLLPGLVGLFTVAVTFALYGTLGRHFTYFSLTLAPFLLCYSLIDAIYLTDYFHNQQDQEKTRKTYNGIRELFFPCFLTSLTTLIGFAALPFTSKTPILREYGFFAAVGIAAAFIITFFLIPACFHFLPSTIAPFKRANRWGKYAAFSFLRPKTIITLFLFGGVILAPHLKYLGVEGSHTNIFPKGNETQKGIDLLAAHLGSPMPITLTVYSTTPQKSSPLRYLAFAMGLEKWLARQPFIQRALSALDFIPMPSSNVGPKETWYAKMERIEKEFQKLPLREIAKKSGGWFTVDERGRPETIRIQAWPKKLSQNEYKKMLAYLDNFERTMMAEFRFNIGGPYILTEAVKNRFIREALLNLAFSSILVFFVTLIPLRSLKLSAIFLIANCIPLLLVGGIMGILGIKFSYALIGLPSILVGIIVDNTIHILWGFKKTGSIEDVYNKKGGAMFLSSFMLIAAFGGELFSDFISNRQFGALAAAGIFLAFVADLSLVPALLNLFGADHLHKGGEKD